MLKILTIKISCSITLYLIINNTQNCYPRLLFNRIKKEIFPMNINKPLHSFEPIFENIFPLRLKDVQNTGFACIKPLLGVSKIVADAFFLWVRLKKSQWVLNQAYTGNDSLIKSFGLSKMALLQRSRCHIGK